ncbi:hypothetical protein Tco_0829289 [Tanacetum coccineum]
MSTLAEHMIVACAENRPPLLDKSMNDSWQSQNGSLRPKKYAELSEQEKLQDDCDVQAINIILQGLTPDVYSLVNHHKAAKDIWDRVNLLLKGTELSYQERECKLYNEFDKFNSVKGETLYAYYLQFAQLINDMHIIGMTMQQVQNLYTTNYDQQYPYLSQHEKHANEVRLLSERYLDPLALVANHQTQSHSAQYPQQLSSTPQLVHSSRPYLPTYEAPHHPQQYQHAFQNQLNLTTPSVSQNAYHTPPISQQPQAEFPQIYSGLVVPVFLPCVDSITCLNKAMAFMSTVGQSFAGMGNKGNATSSRGNNDAGQARVVNPSRHVFTRHQLQNEAMFCYFDDFLTSIEPKNYKEALKEAYWIEAMQEELHEFDRLEV